jgi:hypothetical protein
MDDVLVIGLSIKFLKRSVPSGVIDECQDAASATFKSGIRLDISKNSSSDLRTDDATQEG